MCSAAAALLLLGVRLCLRNVPEMSRAAAGELPRVFQKFSHASPAGYRNQGSSGAHHHSRGDPRAPSAYAWRACRASRGRRARTEAVGRVAPGLRSTSRTGVRSPGGRRFEYPHLGSASRLQSSVALRAAGPRDRCPQRRWAAAALYPQRRWPRGWQAVVLGALVVQGAG